MKKQKLLSVLLLAIFAVGIVSVAVPVSASVSGDFTIVMPDEVVPGGAILLQFDAVPDIDGGTTYFYLSEDDDPEISDGDIYIGSMDTDDLEDELADSVAQPYFFDYQVTVPIPEDVEPDDYWVKISDRKRVEADCMVSEELNGYDDQIEVLEEDDWPTITVDPESDQVWLPAPDSEFNTVDVDGEDIDTDYEWANLWWDKYQGDILVDYSGLMLQDVTGEFDFVIDEDGEFEAEDMLLTEAYMGEQSILVILWDNADPWPESTIGTFVTFNVEPSVDVDPISVEADTFDDQFVDIYAHGFPEGTLDEDTIQLTVKDMTGDVEDVVDWVTHDEVDVEDDPPGTFEVGGAALEITVDEVEKGLCDIDFEVDGEDFTLERQILSSEDSAADEMDGMIDPEEGEVGDDVWFYVIDFPAGAAVDIVLRGADVALSLVTDYALVLDPADANGAWKYRFELEDMAGGDYDVEAWDLTNDEWQDIGTFEVLPTVEYYDEAYVGPPYPDDIDTTYVDANLWIYGTGFENEAEFDTIVIGGEEIELDPVLEIEEDGIFYVDLLGDYDEIVPHISGGGEEVDVELKGEDADGDSLTVESSITIDPRIENLWAETPKDPPDPEEETGVLYLKEDGDWEDPFDPDAGDDIFGGNPMMITGAGFKAGESVTIVCIDDDEDVEEEAVITDGGTADSDGDLEVVFMLPYEKDFGKGLDELEIEVRGEETATTADMLGFYGVASEFIICNPISDADAKIYFGLEDDGDLDLDINVGDEVRLVGVGFEEEDLVLEIEGDEVGEVDIPSGDYGFFDTTITIPELQRGYLEYTVDEVEADYAVSTEFSVMSKVVLSAESLTTGNVVTAVGTGFDEDAEVDIVWPDLKDLVEDIEPDDDGNWEETFTVPDVPPGAYSILFDDEDLGEDDYPDPDDEWDDLEVTFFVLGPLKIASLSMPTTVYPESTISITVNVQDYFGAAIAGATVTGSITPPVGTAISLSFTEAAAGVYTASWLVPADAAEGTYGVDVTAEKLEEGGKATASGTFFVEEKVVPPPPPPPVDISELEAALSGLSGEMSSLAGDVSSLASDVSGLKSDIAALEASIAAIPIVPVEWIYITAIMAVIAAIAAIAAVVAVYRKIA